MARSAASRWGVVREIYSVWRVITMNLGQAVHTHVSIVPLMPSSIIQYQPNGGDALHLGR